MCEAVLAGALGGLWGGVTSKSFWEEQRVLKGDWLQEAESGGNWGDMSEATERPVRRPDSELTWGWSGHFLRGRGERWGWSPGGARVAEALNAGPGIVAFSVTGSGSQ